MQGVNLGLCVSKMVHLPQPQCFLEELIAVPVKKQEFECGLPMGIWLAAARRGSQTRWVCGLIYLGFSYVLKPVCVLTVLLLC